MSNQVKKLSKFINAFINTLQVELQEPFNFKFKRDFSKEDM